MKILIFDTKISGHHLEYIHNIYDATQLRNSDKFIFAIPHFDTQKSEYIWDKKENVSFHFLSQEEISKIKGNKFKRCWIESNLIKKLVKELDINEVILIDLAGVIPFLPLILPNPIKIKGIIYQIFLWKNITSRLSLIIENVRYSIMANNKSVEKVLILNDKKSATELNKKYNSDKFVPLPDPLPEVEVPKIDLSKELNISSDDIVFLHFGAMSRRKGTLDIIKAIPLIPKEKKLTFIFAGKIDKEIEPEFFSDLDIAKQYHNVIVENRFCPYSYIYGLLKLSHCVLVPYHIVSQSSGVIGHASHFHIPVIGPTKGLLGYLIKENDLGICLENITSLTLAQAINEFTPYSISDKYSTINSIKEFQNSLLF